MRILLIEDDELLGKGICEGLMLKQKYIVDWAKDGFSGYQAIKNETFDIITLDLGLPKITGYEILERMRTEGNTTPVLILTARDTIKDRIKGLDLGADDYLVKPFDLDELCARIRALHRRFNARAENLILHGDFVIDPIAHTVKHKNKIVNIPRREFALLQKLLENADRVLSRDSLAQTIYGWRNEVDSNAIEVHIHNLRKKFGSQLIKTIRGVGYIIVKNK